AKRFPASVGFERVRISFGGVVAVVALPLGASIRYRHLGLLVVASLVGCASSRSAQQSVPVITDPSGAAARAGDQLITTPGSLLVPAGANEMEIRIEMAGYETEVVQLTRAESTHFRDCWNRATSDAPKAPVGGPIQGPGAIATAIGAAAVKAASDCSSETDLLEPGFVFRKLVPLPPKSDPSGR